MKEKGSDSLKSVLDRIAKSQSVMIGQLKNMERPDIAALPSGSYTIDHALGVGGYPRGRVIEIFGKESGGKTTISLLAIAETQRNGGVAAFVDVEHSFDPSWAKKLGVNVDDLVFVQPEFGEQALAVVEELAQSNTVDLIVVDSVAGLIPRNELEGELGDQRMAIQARMMSQGLRRLVSAVGKSKSVVLFINQVRETMAMYGEKETTPGGKALKFYSSVRLAVKKVSGSEIKGEGGAIHGHRVNIKVKKSKVAPPFQEAEFTLRFLEGVDRLEELLTLGKTLEIIKQAGPTYSFEDISEKGWDKFVNAVAKDDGVQKKLWKAIQSHKETTNA